jgi:hypothetical protein
LGAGCEWKLFHAQRAGGRRPHAVHALLPTGSSSTAARDSGESAVFLLELINLSRIFKGSSARQMVLDNSVAIAVSPCLGIGHYYFTLVGAKVTSLRGYWNDSSDLAQLWGASRLGEYPAPSPRSTPPLPRRADESACLCISEPTMNDDGVPPEDGGPSADGSWPSCPGCRLPASSLYTGTCGPTHSPTCCNSPESAVVILPPSCVPIPGILRPSRPSTSHGRFREVYSR